MSDPDSDVIMGSEILWVFARIALTFILVLGFALLFQWAAS
jgi:hypothetical protein